MNAQPDRRPPPTATGTPELPQRKRPAHGVLIVPGHSVVVYLTVCTRNREPWLACDPVHALLRQVWSDANAWKVGRYVIMPDHTHLFASPASEELTLDHWVRYWKSQFTRAHDNKNHRWQPNHWDTTLRSGESYDNKWEYVRLNPVRLGLVRRAEDWPYAGELNVIQWR